MDPADRWNHFREIPESIADLKALHQHAKEQAEFFRGRNEETGAEFPDEEARWIFRRETLATMLDLIFDLGKVPEWEELTERQQAKLGGSDAPTDAEVLVKAYRQNPEISTFSTLHDKAEEVASRPVTNWQNKRSNIRDRMNEAGRTWEDRNVEDFIRTLADFEDVDADFGDSEEDENSPK